jgi:hypothetical protein
MSQYSGFQQVRQGGFSKFQVSMATSVWSSSCPSALNMRASKQYADVKKVSNCLTVTLIIMIISFPVLQFEAVKNSAKLKLDHMMICVIVRHETSLVKLHVG